MDYFKPTHAQMVELVRLHDLHRRTLAQRGVDDDAPLFPPESRLLESNYQLRHDDVAVYGSL